MKIRILFTLVVALLLAACSADSGDPETDENGIVGGEVNENGKPLFGLTGWTEPSGKDDAMTGRKGIDVEFDSSDTAVWEVRNQWADVDTPEARAAGMAWGENSGMNWDEKFQAWVASFQKTEKTSGFGETFILTTPWGTELPAPSLECAEVAIFLRITFASWYGLPFFLEAVDGANGRVFFGHMGMRTLSGRYGKTPSFRTRYQDFSERADAVRSGEAEWPVDTKLVSRAIPGSFDDEQPMIGPDAHTGAYFDQIFLNKRVGHFLIITLTFFGSVNLADSVNTFNVVPEKARAGDPLVERWQRRGIGHVLITMKVTPLGEREVDGETIPQLEAELASGSMPRRQPSWETAAQSKHTYTLDETGGPGFEDFGGGLKRWRTARAIGGKWTNVILPDYESEWVNSRHKDELAARPARFEEILLELGPEEKRDVLLEIIESKRAHLRSFPASCSARINREKIFTDLYTLAEDELEMTREQVDREFRTLEDYVFAELVYEKSKTCCWNSSTAAMYSMVMELNERRMANAETGTCEMPLVFMNRDDAGDGFEVFREFAAETNREDQWVAWRADEGCPQSGVAADTEAEHGWQPFCSISDSLLAE